MAHDDAPDDPLDADRNESALTRALGGTAHDINPWNLLVTAPMWRPGSNPLPEPEDEPKPRAARKPRGKRTLSNTPFGLTQPMLRALTTLAEGGRVTDVASALGVSPKTVETYIDRAVARMGARNRMHAVVMLDRALRPVIKASV